MTVAFRLQTNGKWPTHKFHTTVPCQREKLVNLGYRPAKRKENFNSISNCKISSSSHHLVVTLRKNALNYTFVCLLFVCLRRLKFWARFSKVPRLFGRISGDIILFVSSKRRRLEARNFSYFNFYSLYNISTDQLYRLSRSEFHEWLFGTLEKRAPGPSCSKHG